MLKTRAIGVLDGGRVALQRQRGVRLGDPLGAAQGQLCLLETLAGQTDMQSMDGRARLVELARPHLARLPSGVFRDMLRTELAQLAQVDPGKLTMLNQTPGGREAGTPKAPGRPQLNSPVRKAIGYLLYRPALAPLVGSPAALEGPVKGMDVLRELVEFAQGHPHINGAGVLEHWRDRDPETWSFLNKLAQAEIVTPEEALESEFRALMADLTARRPLEQRLDELIAASRRGPLNAAEQAELTRLLAQTAGKSGADSAKSS